jgi:hypothetical protein
MRARGQESSHRRDAGRGVKKSPIVHRNTKILMLFEQCYEQRYVPSSRLSSLQGADALIMWSPLGPLVPAAPLAVVVAEGLCAASSPCLWSLQSSSGPPPPASMVARVALRTKHIDLGAPLH